MITVFIFAISESGLLSMFPVYGLRIGYQPQEFATFLLAMGLGNVVFQIPIGFLIDRINTTLLFVSFALLGFLGAVMIPFISHNVIIFAIIVFFWGGIIPGLYTLGLSRIGSRFDGAELAAANSVFVMNYSIGMLIGPVIVGFGMNSWDPHGAMWIMALIFGLYSIYILSFRFFVTSKIG
ncbi:MAG: MFS transporter [Rickettsiaceae bacterium]|nr:MFS transporter [Rickettsiaceae bacterium]